MSIVARYTQNPDFIYRKIVNEIVLVPICHAVADMNCLYTLNEAGTFLWEQLEQPATREELHSALMDAYAVDIQTATNDLEAYLAEMTAIGAVRQV